MGYIPSPFTPDELLEEVQKSLEDFSHLAASDPDYPALHLAPPVGRLNDPNGLVYKDGLYHAFYQYSPVHPVRAVFWRHATSPDLTHWNDGGSALAPVTWYDRSGCYSGSGIVAPNGDMEFFYTGNVKDAEGNRETYQCLFSSADNGQSFRRYDENPLLSGPEEGYTAHFRDPHVFQRDSKWWALIGAQRENLTGAVVYYTSDDRRTWTFGAEIEFSDTSLHTLGYMFECPILFSLRDQANGELFDVLMFCPQGMESEGERYNNIFQCGYVVGHLRGNFFEVFTPFTEFDSGFEFYAPQVMSNVGDENHVVLMAWLGNADEDDHPSWDFRWMHMLTYPRALTLQRGKILQQPVKQLDQALLPLPVTLTEEGAIAELVGARTFRIQASLDVSQQPVVLSLWDTRGKALAITVDQSALIADRAGSRYTVGGELRRRSVSPRTVHTFELLFDGSALEIFFDDGAEAFTGRVYLHESLEGVLFQTAEGFSAEAQVEKLLMGQL